MARQLTTHGVQQRTQRCVARFHAPQPAAANLVIEQTPIDQRQWRWSAFPQVDHASMPFLAFTKNGLLRPLQRGKQLRNTIDSSVRVEL